MDSKCLTEQITMDSIREHLNRDLIDNRGVNNLKR